MRSRVMNALVESDVSTAKHIESECANHVGRVDQGLRGCQGERSHCQHALCPVDQRDSFLGFEHQRRDLRLAHGISPRNALTLLVKALAFPNQDKRQMCQGCQIATRTYASLRRNDRSNTSIQHFAKRIKYHHSHSGKSLGKGIGAKQHHGPRLGGRKWLAYSSRVRAEKVHL